MQNKFHHNKMPSATIWLAHWILFAAACNIAGWTLSAIHQLNAIGLTLAIPTAWFLLARLIGIGLPAIPTTYSARRIQRRLSKPLPASFIALAALSLIGGILYAPNNFDALIYRLPRVCHWLMAEKWEWIPTTKNNLNTRAAGFEWWTAPMIAILRTDRLIFVLNLVSFLFLPGLFFSLFRHMGVKKQVARAWMWILPAGYCFALQAGSIGNDMIAAFFAVAAFDYAFRWRQDRSYRSFALALLSCSMMTAIKPVTLPLLLPFAVLFIGMWKTVLLNPLRTLSLCLLFSLSSFLPTAIINVRQCGDWTGAAAEDMKLGKVEPIIGVTTNTINTAIQNIIPPVFPLAGSWNQKISKYFPDSYIEANHKSFEPGGAIFAVPDFQGEEFVGLGSGVTLLLIFSLLLSWLMRAKNTPQTKTTKHLCQLNWKWFLMASLFTFSLVAYFSRAGMTTVARHITPYYPFFVSLCLCGQYQHKVVASKAWRFFTTAVITSTFAMILVVPSRPLWPAVSILENIDSESSPILQRAKKGYSVYSERSDGLGPIREALPDDASSIWYLSYHSSAELPLWKPYMERRINHILPTDDMKSLKDHGLRYVVLNTGNFEKIRQISPQEWVDSNGGVILKRLPLQLQARMEPTEWWIIDFMPNNL